PRSKPNKAPLVHSADPRNLRMILFAFEPVSESVIVGPVGFSSNARVPNLMESGGTTTRVVYGKRKRIVIAPRPFMDPAMNEVAPKFPDLFAESVTVVNTTR
ncbi:MAG: hypothetical protein AAFP90_18120, partial [Planctomycetota bacterium]